jgi:hypothetical protein
LGLLIEAVEQLDDVLAGGSLTKLRSLLAVVATEQRPTSTVWCFGDPGVAVAFELDFARMDLGVTARTQNDEILLDVRSAFGSRLDVVGVHESARESRVRKRFSADLAGVADGFLHLSGQGLIADI